MAKRKIVKINENLCNGCGLCVPSCAEGAIQVIDGKAKLVSEIYCDGLGACLGECPMDAITIEERDAEEFDEEKAKQHVASLEAGNPPASAPTSGCPGSKMMNMSGGCPGSKAVTLTDTPEIEEEITGQPSQLGNWPLQLHLVPVNAPYFKEADLIIAADCVGFALPGFNAKLKKNPVVIACPKLDDTEPYVEKLAAIIKENNIKSLTVYHMEVPCCTGIVIIAQKALKLSGVNVELTDITVSINGEIQ